MEKIGDIDWNKMSYAEIDAMLEKRVAYYEESIKANGGKRPKREGYVTERLALMSNLRTADNNAQAGKVKINRHIRRHNMRAEAELRELQLMILTLNFPAQKYTTTQVVTDAGKVRDITKKNFYPWRILDHVIMLVIGPVLLNHLMYHTFACIKGKGLHFGVRSVKKMLRVCKDYKYFVQTDYKKFYESIPHDLIMRELRERFKDEHFLRIIEIVLFSFDSGPTIEYVLENEIKKKRCTHWLVYQSADSKLCN